MKLTNRYSIHDILELAKHSNKVSFAMRTGWWIIGNSFYTNEDGFPCGPKGELLFTDDNPIEFIIMAAMNKSAYGKHELKAFVAGYNGNVVDDNGEPTSLNSWDQYNKLIDDQLQ
jgi:hypothetical protein